MKWLGENKSSGAMQDEHGAAKALVRDFWDQASCGEVYAVGETPALRYEMQRATRYRLEPYIASFARFESGRGVDVLEVGVGMGADHLEWAKVGPRTLTGIDLTPRAIGHTRERFRVCGHVSRLVVGDAERLPFADSSFDLVYSWGVLHHSPHPEAAIAEVHRVLRPHGTARIMIYHDRSLVGIMLWIRYALLTGHPRTSLAEVYAAHLESPGTKAYSVEAARALVARFAECRVRSHLSFGDLLLGAAGTRHAPGLASLARKIWPRWLIRRAFRNCGLMLLIEVIK